MGYFIWMGLLFIVAGVASVGVILGAVRDPNQPQPYRMLPLMLIGVVFAVVSALSTLFAAYNQIETGHVGVVYQYGDIVGERGAGAQFLPPWQSLIEVNVQEQKAIFANGAGNLGDIDASSSETQNVYFDVTLNWRLDRGRVSELYREVGPNFFEVLIRSRVQELFKNEAVKYPAIEITQKRAAIGDNVVKALNGELSPYGLTVVSIQTDNISYSDAFDQAIERKQVATQDALREQELVRQSEAAAQRNEAEARGKALAAIQAAQGEAQSITLKAQAQADANQKLAASLTPALLQSQAIEKMDGTKIAILPSGSGFLLDPSTVLGGLK